jgi:tRNA(Ile)-lysidine synthetase-like protein
VALGATARLVLTNGWQLAITHLAHRELPKDWAQPGQPWRAFFDSAMIGRPLLTTPTTGQHFAPLGLAGQHKALGDLFTDRKIPVALRPQWPLLLDAATQEILWVCGVQLGHRARVTATTAQVLCLRFEQG